MLVKTVISPIVYAVLPNKLIRPIQDEETAKNLYGLNWAKKVIDIPDYEFALYNIGEIIEGNTVHNGMIFKKIGDDTKYYIKDSIAYPIDGEVFGDIQDIKMNLLQNIEFSTEKMSYSEIRSELVINM